MNPSRKREIVFAFRDYPLGCGTHYDAAPFDLPRRSVKNPRTSEAVVKIPSIDDHSDAAPFDLPRRSVKNPRTSDAVVKIPSIDDHAVAAPFDLPRRSVKNPRTSEAVVKIPCIDDHAVAAPKPYGACQKQERVFKNSDHHDHAVAAPKPKGTCLKRDLAFRNSVHDYVVAVPRPKRTCFAQQPAFRNSYHHGNVAAAPRLKGTYSKQEAAFNSSDQHDATPREKVLEVLRLFKKVFRQLDRDKQARRSGDLYEATARIDLKTLAVVEKMGKQVNTEKRIGLVPGINVGDEFQYKTELRVVGLHFRTMCGIDYMTVGDIKFATSIVASEGYGYSDKFDADVVVYTGEGGNVVSKEKKTEDQKMVKGNLALANSMREKRLVRVIRGKERLDGKGKRYVYEGLYSVDKYWLEKEVRGTTVYKFKLCRIPGQPPLT